MLRSKLHEPVVWVLLCQFSVISMPFVFTTRNSCSCVATHAHGSRTSVMLNSEFTQTVYRGANVRDLALDAYNSTYCERCRNIRDEALCLRRGVSPACRCAWCNGLFSQFCTVACARISALKPGGVYHPPCLSLCATVPIQGCYTYPAHGSTHRWRTLSQPQRAVRSAP